MFDDTWNGIKAAGMHVVMVADDHILKKTNNWQNKPSIY